MAKKKQEEKATTPQVNPELLQAEKQYQREKLITESIPRLRKLGLLLWITVDVILIAIFLGYVGVYLITGTFADRRLVATIGENISSMRAVSEARAADPLQIESVRVFSLGNSEYDLYVNVVNPNAQWYAEFEYYFSSAQGDSERFEGSVMPGEVRPIIALRQDFDSRPNNPELIIEELSWVRVDVGDVPDIEGWLEDHNNFVIEDADYNFDVELQGGDIPRTSFTIQNATPYSYWQPEFLVLITRAGTVAGVNTVTISGLESGESREININWFGSVPSSGSVEVIPNINYFDDAVYMDPPGESSEDLRDTLQDRRR